MQQILIGDDPDPLEREQPRAPEHGRGEGRDQLQLFDNGQPGDLPGQALLFPDPQPLEDSSHDQRNDH